MKKNVKPSKQKGPASKPHTVLEVKENTELMVFLIAGLPHKSRNNIKTLLACNQVFVEGTPVKQFDHPLTPGQRVEVRWNRTAEEKKFRGLTIIYEDDALIVIDKDAGMLSIATDTEKSNTAYHVLSTHVKRTDSRNKIFVVHRLDRDTSGLMIFAKSETIQKKLQTNWTEVIKERKYVAVVEGVPARAEGTITSYLTESIALKVHAGKNPEHGQKAVTHYRTLEAGQNYALLELNPATSRKNQVRVQMQEIGHPVTGDKKYGARTNPIKRLALHARVLAFRHPATNEDLRFETPVPPKFTKLI